MICNTYAQVSNGSGIFHCSFLENFSISAVEICSFLIIVEITFIPVEMFNLPNHVYDVFFNHLIFHRVFLVNLISVHHILALRHTKHVKMY